LWLASAKETSVAIVEGTVERIGLADVALLSQLVAVGVHHCIDSRQWHICEVGEVLPDWYVQGVWTIENGRIRLKATTSVAIVELPRALLLTLGTSLGSFKVIE
jgi:hypothetical protein